jgi:hypothetical protein
MSCSTCFSTCSRQISEGTGPVCFLARLCLRAGASEADAVESSDTSVQRAVECFRAEAKATTRVAGWIVIDSGSGRAQR